MKLKKLHIILITDSEKLEYNLLGKCDENTISYTESGALKSNLVFDLKENTLTKDNIDYKITLRFDKKKITSNEIYIKKEDKILNIELETIEYKLTKSKIELKYKIIDSNEKIEYIIEIGE